MMDEKNNTITIKKKDGSNYTVRLNKMRIFFPDELRRFLASFNNKQHQLFFLCGVHTGGRAMEILNLRRGSFNMARKTVTFDVVKQKAAKKSYSRGAERTFMVSQNLLTAVTRYCNQNNIREGDYLFLNNEKLPSNYYMLTNKEKKKYYGSQEISYRKMLKLRLKNMCIDDWNDFALHTLRKTYGSYMRVLNVEQVELCQRMGHDLKTHMEHYSKPLIFNATERVAIQKMMGNFQ